MRFIGLIPARGGSKGVPKKNIALCGNSPLIKHTCLAALNSRIDETHLSTDDEEIAEIVRSIGSVKIPFLRPSELAGDSVGMIEVLRHFQKSLGLESDDVVVLLQPTSPLRTSKHINEALSLFEQHSPDSLVSVMRAPHQFSPNSILRRDPSGFMHRISSENPKLSRQEKEVCWGRNGPAILLTRVSNIRDGDLYGERTFGYEMSKLESLDIDDPDDLYLADLILRNQSSRP